MTMDSYFPSVLAMQRAATPKEIQLERGLESYRLGIESTNALYRIWDGQSWVMVKVYRSYPITLARLARRLGAALGRPIPAQYQTAEQRCRSERQVLEHWADRGFAAPRVLARAIQGLPADRSLVLEYLEGPTLGDLLRDDEIGQSDRWQLVDSVLDEMFTRHECALRENDALLAHLDANTGNVIVDRRGIYRVDFESSLPGVPVIELLAREVFKLCRWIVRDLGPGSLEAVIDRLWTRYHRLRPVLELAVGRTENRSFSWWHRTRDRRRKCRRPGEVTKYDLADQLAACL